MNGHFHPEPKAPKQKTCNKKKKVKFNLVPGWEHSQGPTRPSYAQTAGGTQPDSYQILERLRELYENMCLIQQQLEQNITMPEFNLLNHNFNCAMETHKSLQLIIQESEQVMHEIYLVLQSCNELIPEIEYATARFLETNQFA